MNFGDQKRKRSHNVNYWTLCSIYSLELCYAEQNDPLEKQMPERAENNGDPLRTSTPSSRVYPHANGSACHTSGSQTSSKSLPVLLETMKYSDITEYLHRERQKPVPPHVIEEVEDEEVHHIEEEETNLVIKQRERAHPHIKEGEKLEPAPVKKEDAEEYPHIKHEVEEDIKFPPIGVSLKSVDEGRSEESRGAEPPSSNSSQHVTLEVCGQRFSRNQHLRHARTHTVLD
ncbi:uncharacterized protein LOC133493199 isoform X13 [Syngnathoides biaculeatus]|uniref:uncharacterized protein LOC133493199 isoform X13 n=1 Tax=Syngnathoides biaculeatus TaxID=300417 RepID=UPI002ADDA7CC|nr:uncharacterized protein LOC133493199 isoform X13 [Syngnathoides biaculeatus]